MAKKKIKKSDWEIVYEAQSGRIINDNMGQWKYPGEITRIQGNTMATHGYGDIPLYVIPNKGEPKLVLPNTGVHKFKGANSFTEYPIMQTGGRAPIITHNPNDPRLRAYQDSLDLFNYTNLQHQLEPSWSVIQGNALQNFGIGKDSEFAKNQQKLFNTADSIIKNNPRIEWGTYGDPFADAKGQNGLQEQYGSRGGNSPDIRSKNNIIKPANFWTGAAANHDYIKPVQPVIYQPSLQQVAQNPNPSRVTPSTTQTYQSLQPVRPEQTPISVQRMEGLLSYKTPNLQLEFPSNQGMITRQRQPGERFSALYTPQGEKYSAVDVMDKSGKLVRTIDPKTGKLAFKNPVTGEEQFEYGGELPQAGSGYKVIRSNERKGKTHKVIGPDGTVKFFGDSKLGQHPKDPARKKAFYARHAKNLAKNPYFRAFARKTWEEGGELNDWEILDTAQDGKTINIQDNRTVDQWGNLMKNSQRKNIKNVDKNLVEELIKGSVKRNIDPATTLAMALQETQLGTYDTEYLKTGTNPLHRNGVDDLGFNRNINRDLDFLKQKYNTARSLGKTSDADSIQSWNGYGKLKLEPLAWKNTNMSGDHERMYGIKSETLPIKTENDSYFGKLERPYIDMNKNPVYGKTIVNLRDSVIKQNPEIVDLINKYQPNQNKPISPKKPYVEPRIFPGQSVQSPSLKYGGSTWKILPEAQGGKQMGYTWSTQQAPRQQVINTEDYRIHGSGDIDPIRWMEGAVDVGGLFYYPLSVVGAAKDAYQGDYAGTALGLIPVLGRAGKHGNAWGKAYTKAVNAGVPHKYAFPLKKYGKNATILTTKGAQGVDLYDDIQEEKYGGKISNWEIVDDNEWEII